MTDLDLLQGTLDVMILKALSWRPMHGFGVARWIRLTTEEVLRIEDSALYPALHRLENKGALSADWKLTDTGREAKFYRLTARGRTRLESETANWRQLVEAVGLILGDPEGERR